VEADLVERLSGPSITAIGIEASGGPHITKHTSGTAL
jgi:hypothetical protein